MSLQVPINLELQHGRKILRLSSNVEKEYLTKVKASRCIKGALA